MKLLKEVKIANQYFISVIDTGSDLSLINQECYEKISCPKLKDQVCFDRTGALNNKTYGSFMTNIKIDNEIYEIVFQVVDNSIMKHAILIGADFLNLVELHSVRSRVTIHKVTQELKNDTNFPEV